MPLLSSRRKFSDYRPADSTRELHMLVRPRNLGLKAPRISSDSSAAPIRRPRSSRETENERDGGAPVSRLHLAGRSRSSRDTTVVVIRDIARFTSSGQIESVAKLAIRLCIRGGTFARLRRDVRRGKRRESQHLFCNTRVLNFLSIERALSITAEKKSLLLEASLTHRYRLVSARVGNLNV